MPEVREVGYAWRDNSAAFTEHDAIAQAIQQVINQVTVLPPGSTLYEPVSITYGGDVSDNVEEGAPDQQYIISAKYIIPPVHV